MIRPELPSDDSLLDAYLDDALEPAAREAFEVRLGNDPELARQAELQHRINASLKANFPIDEASAEHVAEVTAPLEESEPVILRFSRRRWAWLAAAAAVAGVLLAWGTSGPRRVDPYFEPTPLAEVYNATVKQGFEPYYECEDDERFARVFSKRQGIPLALLPMPEGSRMLGLSYPGGLSRDTTAMLCRVDGEPVMVFVDQPEADSSLAAEKSAASEDLYIFRDEHDGLVFYEVTPFDTPRAMQYLTIR
ncbi:hypothetical protein NG895_19155 [Aeoliella sp. ICT_H6.2]|uniref:Anti-sigma factor RsiW n=1 Tax=Aeoliella straminimaris TaxID=2954799 RepID=A0A9X2FD45_9BACT|nr:hypothetical protein [Aeoliella straminimaris]MCO6046023.1 hypothetical protein [Aeoliella straminimaris]